MKYNIYKIEKDRFYYLASGVNRNQMLMVMESNLKKHLHMNEPAIQTDNGITYEVVSDGVRYYAEVA